MERLAHFFVARLRACLIIFGSVLVRESARRAYEIFTRLIEQSGFTSSRSANRSIESPPPPRDPDIRESILKSRQTSRASPLCRDN